MKRLILIAILFSMSSCASVTKQGECSILHWPHVDLKDCNGNITVLERLP